MRNARTFDAARVTRIGILILYGICTVAFMAGVIAQIVI
jgi:hypothetical protein